MDEAEDKPAAAAIAPASVKEDDVRFSEFIEMEEGSRGAPGAAKEPEKEPAPARAEVEEPTKEQESDPVADIAVSGRESQAAVDGVAPQVEVVPDEGPASGQAASEDIEPLVKAKAARKPRKKASAAEAAEPVEPETASRSKKKTVKVVEHVPEPKQEEAIRARTPIPDFKEVQAEAARTVGLSEPASSSPIGGKRRKGKALEVWSDDESGEDKAPSPKPFKIAQTAERPPKDTAPEGGETLQEKGKEKPKKKASGKSATTAAVSAATPGPQTRVSPRKTGRGKAATTERDLFSVPSSATDVVVRDEKEQEKSVKRWVIPSSSASKFLVLTLTFLHFPGKRKTWVQAKANPAPPGARTKISLRHQTSRTACCRKSFLLVSTTARLTLNPKSCSIWAETWSTTVARQRTW
jgi:hypothetical protein